MKTYDPPMPGHVLELSASAWRGANMYQALDVTAPMCFLFASRPVNPQVYSFGDARSVKPAEDKPGLE